MEKIHEEFPVNVVKLILVLPKILVKILFIHFLEILEIERAVGVDVFVYHEMFPVFFWARECPQWGLRRFREEKRLLPACEKRAEQTLQRSCFLEPLFLLVGEEFFVGFILGVVKGHCLRGRYLHKRLSSQQMVLYCCLGMCLLEFCILTAFIEKGISLLFYRISGENLKIKGF